VARSIREFRFEPRTTCIRLVVVIGLSTRAEIGVLRAVASVERVEIVGDFSPRSISEIIEDEIPLREARPRNVRASSSRRTFNARPTLLALFVIVDICPP
jgi:hypothetical protein